MSSGSPSTSTSSRSVWSPSRSTSTSSPGDELGLHEHADVLPEHVDVLPEDERGLPEHVDFFPDDERELTEHVGIFPVDEHELPEHVCAFPKGAEVFPVDDVALSEDVDILSDQADVLPQPVDVLNQDVVDQAPLDIRRLQHENTATEALCRAIPSSQVSAKLVASAGNCFLIPPEHATAFRAELLQVTIDGLDPAGEVMLHPDTEEWLKSHAVSFPALTHLANARLDDFVLQREADLNALEERFLQKHLDFLVMDGAPFDP